MLFGIGLAAVGAGLLAIGTHMQHRGVRQVASRPGGGRILAAVGIRSCLSRPAWLLGTATIGIAVICQLAAINFAPLAVVQPLGAIALLVGALLQARLSRRPLGREAITAIALSTTGISLFVASSVAWSEDAVITAGGIATTLALLLATLLIATMGLASARGRSAAIFCVSAAGILYGFVAVCAKVLLFRLRTDGLDLIAIATVIGLAAALVLGLCFVQLAHAISSPGLVIAALTVIDPIVAIALSSTLLGEGQSLGSATPWTLLLWGGSAGVAIVGVVKLAKQRDRSSDSATRGDGSQIQETDGW